MIGPLVVRGNPVASSAPAYAETIHRPAGWTHRIDARGGFISASFELAGNPQYLTAWFENGLSRMVTRHDASGLIVWEGYVFGMTLVLPGIAYTQILKDLSNRTFCLYSLTDFSGPIPVSGETKLTAAVEEDASMNLYGISEGIVNIGGALETGAIAERDTHHKKYRWPARSPHDAEEGGLSLRVECMGFSEWYRHRTYTQTISTGAANASTVAAAVNTATGQFIARTEIDTNSFAVPQFYDSVRREWAWDVLNGIADKGDGGTDDWNWGVYEGRTLRYRETVQEVNYVRRLSDPSKRIYTPSGLTVQPWQLRPDSFLRTLDAFPLNLARSTDLNLDPTVQYIQAVEWDESDPFAYHIEYREADAIPAAVADAVFSGGSRF